MSLGIFKRGKGVFGNSANNPVEPEDIYLLKMPTSTADLINNGEDRQHPFITANDIVGGNGTAIISGDIITWLRGYTYNVPPYTYLIRGTAYETQAVEISLDPANTDPNLDRIDVIVATFDAEGNGVIGVIKGQESAVAVKPTINYDTQIELTFIPVDGNTTQPASVTNLVVYDENVEFTTSDNTTGRVDFEFTTSPFSSSLCLAVTDFVNGDEIKFTSPAPFAPFNFGGLQFQIQPTSGVWEGYGTIKIGFFNGDLLNGTWVTVDSSLTNIAGNEYAFNSASATWQNIGIGIASFGLSLNTADNIRFIKADNTSAESFKLDLIRMQAGIVVSPKTFIKTKLSQFINDGNGDPALPFITAEDIPAVTGFVESVTGTAVDNTDPLNPVVNSTGGLDTLQSVIDANNLATSPNGLSEIYLDLTDNNAYFTFKSESTTGEYTFFGQSVASLGLYSENTVSEFSNITVHHTEGITFQRRTPTLGIDFEIEPPTENGIRIKLNTPSTAITSQVYYIPLSVNGEVADSDGNITIAGGGGGVESVTGTAVDNTDPLNPVIDAVVGDLQAVLDAGSYAVSSDGFSNIRLNHQTFGQITAHLSGGGYYNFSADSENTGNSGNDGSSSFIYMDGYGDFNFQSKTLISQQNLQIGQNNFSFDRKLNNKKVSFIIQDPASTFNTLYTPSPTTTGGTYYLPIKINGQVADSAGNVTISTADLTNLQKEVTTNYAVVAGDNKYTIFLNSATPITVTINTIATANFECDFYNLGAGAVTFVNGTATVGYPDGTILNTDKVCALVKFMATTTYKLKGELA